MGKYLWIALGCLLLALGLNLFLVPFRLSPGGISTLGTVGLYLFRIPLSLTSLLLNTLLFLLGFRYLKGEVLVKGVWGVILVSGFLQLTAVLPPLTEDLLMGTVGGGVLVGLGVGLVIRMGGSTGGSDLAALLLHRFFPHLPIAGLILGIDCGVLLLAGAVFESLSVTFYSLLSLGVAAKVTDLILGMGSLAKSVTVVSGKSREIAACIMEQFSRGVTGIYGRGMYGQCDAMLLLCAVSPKELPALVQAIREIDGSAFLIISDAREVLGEGFKKGA